MHGKVEHQTFLKPGDKRKTLLAFHIKGLFVGNTTLTNTEVDTHIKIFTLVIK